MPLLMPVQNISTLLMLGPLGVSQVHAFLQINRDVCQMCKGFCYADACPL